jgi:hypothetical protein
MWWGGWASQVVNLVHLHQVGLGDIMPDNLKVWFADKVGDIHFAACEVVVQTDDVMALVHKATTQVRAKEASTTSYKNPQKRARKSGRNAVFLLIVLGIGGCHDAD